MARWVRAPVVVPLGPPRFLWARKVCWIWSQTLHMWIVWRRTWSRQLARAGRGAVGLLFTDDAPSGRVVVLQGLGRQGGMVRDWTQAVRQRVTRATIPRSPGF